MDLTQLANLGEFIGGVAVLVTLIYLALQVRHTGKQLDDQNLMGFYQTVYTAYDPLFLGENSELVHAGLSQERELTPSEAFVFSFLMGRVLYTAIPLERADRATQEGSFPIVAALMTGFPGGVEWEKANRSNETFASAFAAYDRIRDRLALPPPQA